MSLPNRRSRKLRFYSDRLARQRRRSAVLHFLLGLIVYTLVAKGAWTAWRTKDLVGGLALLLAYLLVLIATGLHGLHDRLPGFRGTPSRVERATAFLGYFVVAMLAFGYGAGKAHPWSPPQFLPPAAAGEVREGEPAGPVSGGQGSTSGRPAVPVFAAAGDASGEEDFYSRVTGVPAAGVVTLDGTENIILLGVVSPSADDPRSSEAAEALRYLAEGKDVRVRLWAGGPESDGRTAGLVWVMGGTDGTEEYLLNTELVTMGYALLAPPSDAPVELQVEGAVPVGTGTGPEPKPSEPVIPH